MTQIPVPALPRADFDASLHPELFQGTLGRRVVAFICDAIIVGLLMIPAALIVFLLGIVTLGLAWFLYGGLFAIVALGYVALTLGGPASATVGMRWAGVELRAWDGAPSSPILAMMHSLIFWFSVAVLTPFILLVGLFTARGQLLHDLLLGTVVVNTSALVRLEDRARGHG